MAAELRLPVVALPGLSPDSLGNYLASLGLSRVLSRKWPPTRIAWRDEVLQMVGGPSTLDELVNELLQVASDRAWTPYDKAWSNAQQKGTKTKSGEPLALWQASAPEGLLALSAAHAVPHAHVSLNPLLRSSGGRRDFENGWKAAVDALAGPPKKGADPRRDSLSALLMGLPVDWLLDKLNAGSWFADATKLYNSGQTPARASQTSPWAMALACEALALLAGGASRRLGARTRAVGAFPFVTQPVAASAENEADRLRCEIWAPLWARPMTVPEVSALFQRGRAELAGRGALTPAAFATAIHKRGVDAGIDQFRRFTLGRTTSRKSVEPRLEGRFSLAASAVSASISLVLERATMLIEQRGFPRDGKRFAGLRGPIESALLDVAAAPDRPDAGIALLDAVVFALDRIDHNRSFREKRVQWQPLPIEWLPSLFEDEAPGVEARLALALVSGFPEALPFTAFRFGVSWTLDGEVDGRARPRRFEHAKVAPPRWVWRPGDISRAIGAVLARRLLEEPKLDFPGTRWRGRAPLPASADHLRRWLAGDVDEPLLTAWLSRLALFDWKLVPNEVRALAARAPASRSADGELALLGLVQPLVDRRRLVVDAVSPEDLLDDERGARTPGAARSLVTLVRSANLDSAARLAASRYAMAGVRLATFDASWRTHDPDRLVAALLFPLSGRERATLVERWLRPRRRPQGDVHAQDAQPR
ncbi:MAG: type I-U CRISPR-associated protein Csx17 [bacterium]|nr:type I-U CRISPR-associated protein Csx17 [bacterium]